MSNLNNSNNKTISTNNLAKVAVLMGGKSSERDVSIMSGNGVLEALIAQGVNAHKFDPQINAISELEAAGFTSVFIALHGRFGEDGVIQGVLEYLGIPYTGSGVMASAIAINKDATKRIWQDCNLPTPKFKIINDSTNLQNLGNELGFPFIIKPAREGSSLGVTKVNNEHEIQDAYKKAAALDREVMAEVFISGRELTCAIVEIDGVATTLPLIEIQAPQANYDYNNKYFTDDVKYVCPAQIDELMTKQIQDLALQSFNALNCRGWARADIMLSSIDNKPYLLEINTSPGMTNHSLVPMAAKSIGMDYASLVMHILQNAQLDYKQDVKINTNINA
jgi:D-alanine-D-alanine ligase